MSPQMCTDCGSELAPGQRFCPGCGTPGPAAPTEAVAAPPPKKTPRRGLWLLLVGGGGLVLLACICIAVFGGGALLLDTAVAPLATPHAIFTATHFNGFPQPVGEIARVCRERGVFVIEDCAHVLQTESPDGRIGTLGDFAVLSPAKILHIRNGGLLEINNPVVATGLKVELQNGPGLTSDLLYATKTWLKDHVLGNYAAALHSAAGDDIEVPEPHDFGPQCYAHPISPLSRYMLRRIDLASAAEARKRNYVRCEALLDMLPEHVDPFVRAMTR